MHTDSPHTHTDIPRRAVVRWMLWAAIFGLAAGAYLTVAYLRATS